jgi:hypothetical protein
MSHYDDQSKCTTCSSNGFVPLDEAAKYRCGPACTSKYLTERSTMDQMAYDYYVLGKPVGPFQNLSGNSVQSGYQPTQYHNPNQKSRLWPKGN